MIREIVNALARGRNVVILHSNADADAVGSGIALAGTFENTFLYAPGGLSRVGKKLAAHTSSDVLESTELADYDNIVVVDASSEKMIGVPVDWKKTIVIDHHPQLKECDAGLCHIDDTYSSCCEMIWKLIGSPETIDEKIALALLTGILADSGHFHHADHDTFIATAEIMKAGGVTIQEAMAFFDMEGNDEMSQRISRLKGGQRLKYLRKGQWLVATSRVNSFEASAARGLLGLGADVAFVASQDKIKFRLTGRAKPDAVKSGLHLGKMLTRLSREMNGEAGGHDGAAGWSGTGDVEAVLNMAAQKALEILSK